VGDERSVLAIEFTDEKAIISNAMVENIFQILFGALAF